MFLHVEHSGEVLATVAAGIGSLPSMDPLMLNQVTFGCVRFDAPFEGTDKGPLLTGQAGGGKKSSKICTEVFLVANQLQLTSLVFISSTN